MPVHGCATSFKPMTSSQTRPSLHRHTMEEPWIKLQLEHSHLHATLLAWLKICLAHQKGPAKKHPNDSRNPTAWTTTNPKKTRAHRGDQHQGMAHRGQEEVISFPFTPKKRIRSYLLADEGQRTKVGGKLTNRSENAILMHCVAQGSDLPALISITEAQHDQRTALSVN
ncbi:uncharacterized protein BJ212DRAFT_1294726 [Suillus subaureus]|uniref:Uncharacterized protein n=1 Tax=Suillus subaureus TaxID=48587 RepID=A0A9P7EQR6_9AGAM|nr:uncharacterized protein BJ212DRAFT_1294726 [Suillus subaureus]KAG1827453.1 hypothetical protein BJ212DRAFT_1294726 [Suillus subaureus]